VRYATHAARTAAVTLVLVACGLSVTSTAGAALRAPRPQAPAAGASVQSLPAFSWARVPGAARYEFQLSSDAKFASIVLGTGRGKGSQRTRNTAATLDATVPDGRYHWRVRAITGRDRAGRWSAPRTVTKAWTSVAQLQAPSADSLVMWPALPLVLRWSPVAHATKYLVTVASDPSLAQSVIAKANVPVETQGTAFTLQGTLASGRYYWAITPVDGGGHRGTRSAVGSFSWSWPTATATRVLDLNDTAQVFDPLLDWNPVPGAARYEVEINPDDEFSSGSRVCCKERVLGSSLAPQRVLPNNNDFAGSSGYHWRVRAFDVDDNPGEWSNGPAFAKAFDDTTPSVPNLRIELAQSADPQTSSPIVRWDPVPGAAEYQLQWTRFESGICGWSNASGPVKTSSLAWTPLSPNAPTGVPGGIGITQTMRPNGTLARWGQPFTAEKAYLSPQVTAFADNTPYCLRVRALSDDSYRENDSATSEVISQWTQVGGDADQPAFTYDGPPTDADPAAAQLPAPAYLEPVGGEVAHTPLLRWAPVAGARRYFVIVARDSNFTDVVDAAFTAMPAYAPNLALEDEESSYFWAVIPSVKSNGSQISAGPRSYDPQSFRKLSAVPALLSPGAGADVATQPTFRWTPSQAAQKYRVQVSSDPDFGTLLDDVLTASTAYTSQSTYPADTALYWRVRGEQRQVLQAATERVEQRWSATASFRRRLQAPVPAADNPTSGGLIPVFAWSAVPGAVSYDLHVDEADGDIDDFTLKSTAFAPSKFFGTGIFRYKVRANFATRGGVVKSAYSAPAAFTRIIAPPQGARLTRTKTRLVLSWEPASAARRYLVQVSSSDSFAQILDSVRTDNTSWAPDLTNPQYRRRGALYWRVATVDEGGNAGAYATGAVGVKKLAVVVRGTLKRGLSRRLAVSVRSGGRALRGATVRVSGAGLRASTRRTSGRGTATFVLRPGRRGTVSLAVSRSGYATTRVRVKVR
jgi:hypothetical protein